MPDAARAHWILPRDWKTVAAILRDERALDCRRFDDLTALCVRDITGIRDGLSLHLWVRRNHGAAVHLATRLEGARPKVASLSGLWPVAEWFENEVFDMFGVHFENHPRLGRIFLPSTYVGHPLRDPDRA
jgi:NADH:ubiquinone oxidoreductase subunit C